MKKKKIFKKRGKLKFFVIFVSVHPLSSFFFLLSSFFFASSFLQDGRNRVGVVVCPPLVGWFPPHYLFFSSLWVFYGKKQEQGIDEKNNKQK